MKQLVVVPMILLSLIVFIAGCGQREQQGSPKPTSNADFGKNDYKTIIPANNNLGFQLITDIKANKNGNILISPTSLLMALSMVYNGAEGKTKTEMAETLNMKSIDAVSLNKANASLLATLDKDSDKVQLNIANSIWLNENFHFRDDFAESNRDYFDAKIQEIDVSDSASSKEINSWVNDRTKDKIHKIVNDSLDSNLVALLVNAIYFKGDWAYAFDKKQTRERTFHPEDGTTKDMPLMRLKKKLPYMENDHFQAVSLPYGDKNMSMKVFLPKENSSLKEFLKMLTSDNWKDWSDQFQKKKGTVLLPKFQLKYDILLNEPLKELGMKTAFDKNHADFSKMIQEDQPAFISKVKQKTSLEVNEEGTEAAAATSVGITTSSATVDGPFRMEVNRPFFVAISDDETGAILFMGSISNPQKDVK